MWYFHNPVKIIFGDKVRSFLIDKIKGLRILIVTTNRGRNQLINDPILKKITENSTWVDNVKQNPTIADTEKILLKLRPICFDAVVAFGGGSTIDTAKALVASIAVDGNKTSLVNLLNESIFNFESPLLPIYAIPTTAGTGSEVTPFATIWDQENKKKMSLNHPELYPKLAIVDPELTYGLPYLETISTGLDALNQAFESIWNKNKTVMSNTISAIAIGKALKALLSLSNNLNDKDARSLMAEASLLAGLSISHTKTAICHSISYPLTAKYNIKHGFACSFSMMAVAKKVIKNEPTIFDMVLKLNNFNSNKVFLDKVESLINIFQIKEKVLQNFSNTDEILELTKEMISPGRSDNFILPVNQELIKEIINDSFT